jgi:hypothetical protein
VELELAVVAVEQQVGSAGLGDLVEHGARPSSGNHGLGQPLLVGPSMTAAPGLEDVGLRAEQPGVLHDLARRART